MPNQVVIVASGEDIDGMIKNFGSMLPITYRYTREVGQSFQKKLGISLFEPDIDWVMLLDDDLLVDESTIKIAKETIGCLDSDRVVGIGMNVSDPETRPKIRIVIKQLMKYRLGKISKFGIPTHYMGFEKVKTQWLNGASIWKLSVLTRYELPFLNSKHAALEDAIFSSSLSEEFDLLYIPEITLSQQIVPNLNVFSLDRFKYMTLWNTYFVCINPKTNIFLYKLLIILRLLKYIFRGHHYKSKELQRYIAVASSILFLPNDKDLCQIKVLDLLKNEIYNDNK
jgi:hypothetical protein